MDNSDTTGIKEYKFKMDKVERYVSFGVFLIFIFSFSSKNSGLWTIILFAVTIVIMAYYFIWYRKKPSYLIVEDEQITVHPPLFYKPQQIKKHDIRQVKVSDKKIEIDFGAGGTNKIINVYPILMEVNDWKELSHYFNSLKQ